MLGAARYSWVRQVVALLILVALWEAAGRAGMLNPLYLPSPSQVGAALVDLFSDGHIWPHLEATFTAALGGLVLGIAVGAVLGVAAALVRLVAELLEPVMTLLNAVPRVVLAPLFVIWLGIGIASKKTKLKLNLVAVHPSQFGKLIAECGNARLRFQISFGQTKETANDPNTLA